MSCHRGLNHFAISRRLASGSLAVSGLSLGPIMDFKGLAAGRADSVSKKPLGILMVFASGGQSQLETWDPKPEAPVEVRGAFKTIATATNGLRVCEHLPKLAGLSNKYCVFRSLSHDDLDHGTACYLTLTGRHHPLKSANPNPSPLDHPSLSSVFSKINPGPALPFSAMHINGPLLIPSTTGPGQDAGFLGKQFSPALLENPAGDISDSWGLTRLAGLPSTRIDGRRILLEELDSTRADLEAWSRQSAWPKLNRRAYNLLNSDIFRKALDINSESERAKERYGHGRTGRACLMARRMIEAGLPWVTVFLNHSIRGQDEHPETPDWFGWDTHNDIFESMKTVLLPRFDRAISALIEDMDIRGLLNHTLVVVLGEFGRAPLVAAEKRFAGTTPGRKHWAGAYSMIAFGAGIPGGRVVGETDRWGGSVQSKRASPADVAATMLQAAGIDPTGTFTDSAGRIVPLVEGKPIKSWWVD